MAMPFDWNPTKAATNHAKHGVWFEAIEEFDWTTAMVFADVRGGYPEPRLGALGAIGDRLHFVVYTVERRSIRIISLRKANRKEVTYYARES